MLSETNSPDPLQPVTSISDERTAFNNEHTTTSPRPAEAENPKSKSLVFGIVQTNILRILSGIGVVMYWRGMWQLLDSFAGDLSVLDNVWRSALQSIVLSAVIPFVTALYLYWSCIPSSCLISTKSYQSKHKFLKKSFQYALIMLLGFASVAFWRGIWMLCDYALYPNDSQISFIISIVAGLLTLAVLQSCSSAIAAPIVFVSDKDSDFYINELHQTATVFKRIYGSKK